MFWAQRGQFFPSNSAFSLHQIPVLLSQILHLSPPNFSLHFPPDDHIGSHCAWMAGDSQTPWVPGFWSQWPEAAHVSLGCWRQPMARSTLTAFRLDEVQASRRGKGQSMAEFVLTKAWRALVKLASWWNCQDRTPERKAALFPGLSCWVLGTEIMCVCEGRRWG